MQSLVIGTSVLQNNSDSSMLTCFSSAGNATTTASQQPLSIEDCWTLCYNVYVSEPQCIAMEYRYERMPSAVLNLSQSQPAAGGKNCCLLLVWPGDTGAVYFKLPPSNDPRSGVSSLRGDRDGTGQVAEEDASVHEANILDVAGYATVNDISPVPGRTASPLPTHGRVQASSIASGLYVRHTYNTTQLADEWGPVITLINDPDLTDSEQQTEAAALCDLDATCWGFTKESSASGYALRTGSYKSNVRSVVVVERDWMVNLSQDSQQIVYPGKSFDATRGTLDSNVSAPASCWVLIPFRSVYRTHYWYATLGGGASKSFVVICCLPASVVQDSVLK